MESKIKTVTKEDLQNRKFLQSLGDAADEVARTNGLNPHWKRVYTRLSDSACELDAYISRITLST